MGPLRNAALGGLIVAAACTPLDLSTPESIAKQVAHAGFGCHDLDTALPVPTRKGEMIGVCSMLGDPVTIHTADRDQTWSYTHDPAQGPLTHQVFDDSWLIGTSSRKAAEAVHLVLGGTLRSV